MNQRRIIRAIVVVGAACALWNGWQGWLAGDTRAMVLWTGVLLLSFGWWNLAPEDIVVPWRANSRDVRIAKCIAWAGSALVVATVLAPQTQG